MANNFCPNCGTKLESNATACSFCGQIIEREPAHVNLGGTPIKPPSAPPEYLDQPRYQKDTTIFEMFLSINGRLNRLRYVKRSALLVLIEFILAFAIALVFKDPFLNDLTSTGYVAMAIMLLIFAPPHYMLMIRRLHDLNKTGWFCLLMLIPFVNTIFSLYVLFAPGTVGYNQYGADPVEGIG